MGKKGLRLMVVKKMPLSLQDSKVLNEKTTKLSHIFGSRYVPFLIQHPKACCHYLLLLRDRP